MITNSTIITEAIEDMQKPETATEAVENVTQIIFSEITRTDAVRSGLMELYHLLITEPDAGIRDMVLNTLQAQAVRTKAIIDEFTENVRRAVAERGTNEL